MTEQPKKQPLHQDSTPKETYEQGVRAGNQRREHDKVIDLQGQILMFLQDRDHTLWMKCGLGYTIEHFTRTPSDIVEVAKAITMLIDKDKVTLTPDLHLVVKKDREP